MDTEECEERSERRNRNRTEKGLQFDLEIGTRRKERAAKDVRSVIYFTTELKERLENLNESRRVLSRSP